MREKERNKISFTRRLSLSIDRAISVLSPKAAFGRANYRFAYDAIDGSRTRKKRSLNGGTADSQLTEHAQDQLREIFRDLCINNPLVNGLLKTERDGLIGSGVKVKFVSSDEAWNKKANALWRAEMIESPCEVTGRFNFNQYLRIKYLSYRRDGDSGTIFTDFALQAIEGEQIGTPLSKTSKNYKIVNGLAFSTQTGKLLGYYIGKPAAYGYIEPDSWKKYDAENVHMMFSPERFSQSRGEPVLASSIDWIDKLCGYMDAELVAAKVNAAFSVFVSRKEGFGVPGAFTGGSSSTGLDPDGKRLEKVSPGTIMYGKDGESATGIGQVHPGSQFDPFTTKMLAMIGRPLLMPLILITGDFSGATFMNARIAYQKVQESWIAEQENVVKPFVVRVARWKLGRLAAEGKLSARDDVRIEIQCNRWPYVDPFKEANADAKELDNGTTTREKICQRKGEDIDEVTDQLQREKQDRQEKGLEDTNDPSGKNMENYARAVRSGVPISVIEARVGLGLPEDPPKGDRLRFNDQNLLQYHIENGIVTINEGRARMGLPSVAWGDVPVRKSGVAPVETGGGEKDKTEDEDEKDGE